MSLLSSWPWGEAAVLLLAYLLRCLTGLSSYSGADDPPKYGDYEAQRHWMEIAVNFSPRSWYTDSQHNNFTYWPLDYPPVSGYQSWLHGKVLQHFEPPSVALGASHGYETPSSKLIMRGTVLASDLAVYLPAVLLAVRVLHPAKRGSPRASLSGARSSEAAMYTLASLLLQPALMLIDHGHFQYNCISLGFATAAAAAIMAGHSLWGSVLFCLSLNHKQMALYYAPAFFAHLLGMSLRRQGIAGKVMEVFKLGVVVLATFAMCWLPYLSSADEVLKVVGRIFPVKRGLYEDYVANFWCATSLLIKWKSLLPNSLLLKACLGATLAAAFPAMLHQILRPSPRGLLYCMANSAFAFYMFAYQVHEKSVLLPLLPITMLASELPATALWTPLVASFSMFPLLIRDGVALPYTALCAAYPALLLPLSWRLQQQQEAKTSLDGQKPLSAWLVNKIECLAGAWQSPLGLGGVLAAISLHAAAVLVPAPARYPWLYDRAFITLAFMYLAVLAVYMQIKQWALPCPVEARKQKQN